MVKLKHMESGTYTNDSNQEYNPNDPGVGDAGSNRKVVIGLVVGALVMIAIVVGGAYVLMLPATPTDRIRDIFIIFMALESLVLGVALVILIVQLARLINLLQNEIQPILETTNETVNTLRGTTEFISSNVSEPIIRLNGYLAGLQQAFRFLGIVRETRSKTTRRVDNSQGE